jgi:hypothetical protein
MRMQDADPICQKDADPNVDVDPDPQHCLKGTVSRDGYFLKENFIILISTFCVCACTESAVAV